MKIDASLRVLHQNRGAFLIVRSRKICSRSIPNQPRIKAPLFRCLRTMPLADRRMRSLRVTNANSASYEERYRQAPSSTPSKGAPGRRVRLARVPRNDQWFPIAPSTSVMPIGDRYRGSRPPRRSAPIQDSPVNRGDDHGFFRKVQALFHPGSNLFDPLWEEIHFDFRERSARSRTVPFEGVASKA
jgi:hypothetical protein